MNCNHATSCPDSSLSLCQGIVAVSQPALHDAYAVWCLLTNLQHDLVLMQVLTLELSLPSW